MSRAEPLFLDTSGLVALLVADNGARKAFTNDRHFEQAGFRRILAAPA